MASKKPSPRNNLATNKQGLKFANLARKFGVDNLDLDYFLNEKEYYQDFFKKVKNPSLLYFDLLKKRAENIYAQLTYVSVVVDYRLPYKKILEQNTECSIRDNVSDLEDKYLFKSKKKVVEEIVLVRILAEDENKVVGFRKMINWAYGNGLALSNPYSVLALLKKIPKIKNKLGLDELGIAETSGCYLKRANLKSLFTIWSRHGHCIIQMDEQGSRIESKDLWFAFILSRTIKE